MRAEVTRTLQSTCAHWTQLCCALEIFSMTRCSKHSGLPTWFIQQPTNFFSIAEKVTMLKYCCWKLVWQLLAVESYFVLEMKEASLPASQALFIWTPNPGQRGYTSVSFEVLAHFSLMKSLNQWSVQRRVTSPLKGNWERGAGAWVLLSGKEAECSEIP